MSLNQILDRLVWNGMALTLFIAPIAIGSVHWPAKMGLAGLAGALLLAYCLLMLRRGYRLRLDGFVVLGVVVAGMILFQLLPLGDALLETLSPVAAETVVRARALGYDIPSRIALDPVAAVDMLVLLGTAMCLYIVSFNLAYRDRVGDRLLAMIGIVGGIVALIVFAHAITNSKLILGFYAPAQGISSGTPFFSTFVNSNNGAAFLNLAAFILAGQWQKAHFGKSKGLYALLVAVTMAASIALLSRGGLLSLLLAGGTLAFITRWAGGPRRSTQTGATSLVGLAVTLACVGMFLAAMNVLLGDVQQIQLIPFAGDPASKTMLWEKAAQMVTSYQTAGAGAGGFLNAFNPINDFAPRLSYLHAENELLEPLIEYGVPCGALLIASTVLLFWRRLGFARSDGYYAGAMCGVLAVGIHSLADFGLRIPGVLLPVAVAMGTLSGAYGRSLSKARRWWLKMSGLKALPLAAIIYVLLLTGGLWAHDNSAENAYEALAACSQADSSISNESKQATVKDVMNWHGHDGHIHYLVGRLSAATGDDQQARKLYLQSTLMCPACLPPKVGLAQVYLRAGEQEEALKMLLEVARDAGRQSFAVFWAIHTSGVDEATVVEAWREDPEMVHNMARYLIGTGNYGTAEVMLRESLRTIGYSKATLAALGKLYVIAKKLDRADETATYLMGMYPDEPEGYIIQARVFVRQSLLEEALLMFEEARERTPPGDVELTLEAMSILGRTRSWDRFETLAVEVRTDLGDNQSHRSRYHRLMAMREEMRGNYFGAMTELDQAEDATPLNIWIPLLKAELHKKLDRPQRAAEEYRKALKLDPGNSNAIEGLRELEIAGAGRKNVL